MKPLTAKMLIATLLTFYISGCANILMDSKNIALLGHSQRYPIGYYKLTETTITVTDGKNVMRETSYSTNQILGLGSDSGSIAYSRSEFLASPELKFLSKSGDRLSIILKNRRLIQSAKIVRSNGDVISFFGYDPAITSREKSSELESKGWINSR